MELSKERPHTEPFKIKPARKDILMDGNGLIVQIEIGPRQELDAQGKEVYVAYVSAQIDSDFRYFYPRLESVPNQYPELFRIESPIEYWQQLNDDSYTGAWLLYRSFDGKDSPMTKREKDMFIKMETMKFRESGYELEILRLREENENLRSKTENELTKYNLLIRKLKDTQPAMFQQQQQGDSSA